MGCCLIILDAHAPGQGVPATQDVVGDLYAGPVEITVVAELGAGSLKLVEQIPLGCSGHAVGTDEWGAMFTQTVGGYGQQIGVFADVYDPSCHVPGRWVT